MSTLIPTNEEIGTHGKLGVKYILFLYESRNVQMQVMRVVLISMLRSAHLK